jgi:hypothetical protein
VTDHDDHTSAPEERELRVLLEHAVPTLPAPAQRLESVRERVRRRRRRRAAGLSATVVLAIAAAGLLLPGPGDRDGGGAPLATTTLAPPASGSAPTASATTDGPTAPPGYTAGHFDNLAGLGLVVPDAWTVLSAPDEPRAYVSSQSLGLPKGGCAHQLDDFCTPLDHTLKPDGVLVQFTLAYDKGLAMKTPLRGEDGSVRTEGVLSACRAVGGTAELGRTVIDASGSSVVVAATACLAHPRPAQEARVRALLAGADFY